MFSHAFHNLTRNLLSTVAQTTYATGTFTAFASPDARSEVMGVSIGNASITMSASPTAFNLTHNITGTATLEMTETITKTILSYTPNPSINNCQNLISEVNGQSVGHVSTDVEGSYYKASAQDAYHCCTICQSTAGCAYSTYNSDTGCQIALVGGQCLSSRVVGYFYTSSNATMPLTVSNGSCGEVVYGGLDFNTTITPANGLYVVNTCIC